LAFELRGKRIVALVAVLVLAVLIYAWSDGGREPVREIVQPVTAPLAVGGNAR
jgi:hypothetical protein